MSAFVIGKNRDVNILAMKSGYENAKVKKKIRDNIKYKLENKLKY
jgi:hypothetical protein